MVLNSSFIFLQRIIIFICIICFSPVHGFADNWQAKIYENGAPPSLVGVDKKNGLFNFFEKKSPLSIRYSYPCVTGQLKGDKQQINDLRTPEGVYFVEYKIAGGLDFKEYGGIAYTLNYPNPVDRLRGKTGHGIWIHSKGFELVPTRGCVAIDLQNIAEVGPRLTPGTPVVVAEELKGVSGFDDGIPAQLTSLMSGWSNAWAAKSPDMFSYYNPDAYSKATENFDAFRQNKEKLFKLLSFIKIFNREIHALEGPGYWVTWAEQLYTASNLSTEGVRRLYWQKDDNGRFRIVGMEWIPKDLGMKAEFQKGKLVAQAPADTLVDAASEAPQLPKLDMPEEAPAQIAPPPLPEKIQSQSDTQNIAAPAKNLVAVGEPLIPRRQPKAEPPDEISWGVGKRITEPAETSQKNEPAPSKEQIQDVKTLPKVSDNTLDAAEVMNIVGEWDKLYQNKDNQITGLYDQKSFNRLPAKMGIPKELSLNNQLNIIKREFAQPWLKIIYRKPAIEIDGEIARSTQDIMILGPQVARQGVQTLWWHKDDNSELKIVGAQFKQQPLGLEANYLDNISDDVTAMIENWRKAWESGKIDDYIANYAPNAWQQGRSGTNNIRRQKEGLWGKVRPAMVQLSGIRLSIDPKGIRADMNQAYADSAGRSDKGVKTLLLRYDGKRWLIHREDWAPPAAN